MYPDCLGLLYLRLWGVADGGTVPLKAGDHVVWVSDTGQDRGVVKWLQWTDDGQLKVGVYFVSKHRMN